MISVGVNNKVMLNVLRCRLTYEGQAVTNAEAWFNTHYFRCAVTTVKCDNDVNLVFVCRPTLVLAVAVVICATD